ncbi:MAG: tetratricopeptide repeat protein [Phycisphaeraceae bacterium]|nr:MAG: tetratricopeptide repeat protein [Phycisphaeraceae bacterium]
MAREPITLTDVHALLASGKTDEARRALQAILQREPKAHAPNLLAAQLAAQREDHAQAVHHARIALDASPGDAQILKSLTHSLVSMQRFDEAIEAYREALRRDPLNSSAMLALSGIFLRADRLSDAEKIMETAVSSRSDLRELWHEYAVLFLCTGRAAEALAILERAGIRHPQASDIAIAAASISNYVPGLSPDRIRQLHDRAARLFAPPGLAPVASFLNTPDQDRPLTVGFVSGDFHSHSISYFLLPLLERIDRSRVKPELFWTGKSRDATTERFMSLARLHTCRGRPPSDVAREIRSLGVDVLIDLSGYTMDHGLHLFALKPAPVQLSAIGYPASTRLKAIDARIGDSITDTPEADRHDRVLRLDPCFLCYQPPADPLPDIDDPSRPPTFGSFNSITKINPLQLSRWAALLRSVPHSRLLLKADMRLTAVVSAITGAFKREGIEPDRLQFMQNTATPSEARALYGHIDVALDTYPYNGTTTTCESLWMGVPVVTLRGETHVQRVSASILSAIGLQELIAETNDEYNHIAAQLVSDRPRVRALRDTLRERMLSSPLCDATAYATRFESAIRAAWRAWCESVTHRAESQPPSS